MKFLTLNADTKVLENFGCQKQVAMGVVGRKRLRRPEIRRMVEEVRHDRHGILQRVLQDDQLQIKWEESTSPACGGWEA